MSLRIKCAILLIAFELTIAVTLFVTVRYIRNYFEDAAQAIASSSRSSAEIRRLRLLVRDELSHLQVQKNASLADDERARIRRDIEAASNDVMSMNDRTRLDDDLTTHNSIEALGALLEQRQQAITRWEQAGAQANFPSETHLEIDRLLGQWETLVFESLSATAQGSFDAFYRSVLVLSSNMVVGALLGVLGLVLVRRWVLLPVNELTHAADEFGRGKLDHRAKVRTRDELGRLATAMNDMSADINRLNRQMIYRERAAAMGELISYIAHNIRNPLAGIRSLTESCQRGAPPDSEMAQQHTEIVASVERLQHWLREVEHACRPLDVQPQAALAAGMVGGVVDVFGPMAARRKIEIQVHLPDHDDAIMQIDTTHFEQALAAVVGNAIEACDEGGRVTIDVEARRDDGTQVISVQDTGPGIPPEVRERVFQPSVSSKRDGTGLGLAMARRVAALHGGELTFECPPGGGTIFRFTLPAMNGQGAYDG